MARGGGNRYAPEAGTWPLESFMHRLTLAFASLALAASAAPAAAAEPSDLDRYVELQDLYGRGFTCTRPVRRSGPMRPEILRLQSDWDEALARVRAALVRREGEERVAAAERSLDRDEDDSAVHYSGPCSLAASDRARAAFSHRLPRLERRLGLARRRRD
jgi:hypothetical protein